MKRRTLLIASIAAGLLTIVATSPSFAAGSKAEIGVALASITMGLGNDKTTVVAVPASGFGLLDPGLYGSLFVGSSLAIEPQLGLIWVSSGGASTHFVHVAGQLDYFLRGTGRASPYVFASVGAFSVSDSGASPKSAGGGVGYRMPVGDRLTFRFDGRFMHLTESAGNTVTLAVSMGGLFGRR